MTFLELQNALLPAGVGNTARFKENQRPEVQRWLNDRYAELWGLEDWTFRKNFANLTVTAADDTPTMPTDFGISLQVWDAQGAKVPYLAPDKFFAIHLPSATDLGPPSVYTIVNGQIYLDPTPGAAATWKTYYERKITPLAADGDIPLIPVEHHYALVHGAEATGQTRMQDFTYSFSEQRWQNQLAAMRRNYLVDQRGDNADWGSDTASWVA